MPPVSGRQARKLEVSASSSKSLRARAPTCSECASLKLYRRPSSSADRTIWLAANDLGAYGQDRGQTIVELLDAQAWRLSWWRVAAHDINYRRFFDINELVALRIE